MRVHKLVVLSATVAALFCGSGANAFTGSPLDRVSLDVQNYFSPVYQDDGSVYGVRASAAGSKIPSLQILPVGAVRPVNTPTPGPCASAGFPGGWCNTAHSIAVSAFGWDSHTKGAGAIIGIVDTGIDLNHPDFAGRILTGTCIASAVNPCTLPDDQVGGDDAVFPGADATHGTHVTGIAAGAITGLASQASILPVKVCGSNTDSCIGVDQGIVWASQHGANVISVSIGGPILVASDIAMLRTAVSNGSLLVVAAGNSGFKDPTSGFLAGAALQDGIRGSMVVVGATGCNGPNPAVATNCANGGLGGITSFSQVPGTRCEIHSAQRFCMRDYFVVAPGEDIWSTVGNGTATGANYGYLSGTSMATPFVSGVATVIKGQWPTLSSSDIANIIFETADDIGAPGDDPVYGRGAVDITKALSPVGASVVATSGSLAKAATVNSVAISASIKGATGATTSYVSGALTTAVRNSTILKHAVVVDSFGRDFSADLTKATYNPGFNFVGLVSDQFTSYSPFATDLQTPAGNFTASGYAVDTTTPRLLSGLIRSSDREQYDLRDLSVSTALAPGIGLDFGYKADMAGQFNDYDADSSAAYNGLFYSASAVNSPYASLTNGGNFLGTTIALADDLHFRFGASSLSAEHAQFDVPVYSMAAQLQGPLPLYDQRQAQSSTAGMSWDFASWGGLGITASQTREENGLLGGVNSGSLAMAQSADTSALGLSARVGFGDGWVTTVSYSEGITQLNLRPDGLLSGADALHSRAYGVAIAKRGLFGDDDLLGFALTRPVQIYAGGVDITAADGVDANNNLTIANEHVSLASATPETDVELGYVTTFLDGALALQANAGYQMNLQGQAGVNSVSVLSRAKINF